MGIGKAPSIGARRHKSDLFFFKKKHKNMKLRKNWYSNHFTTTYYLWLGNIVTMTLAWWRASRHFGSTQLVTKWLFSSATFVQIQFHALFIMRIFCKATNKTSQGSSVPSPAACGALICDDRFYILLHNSWIALMYFGFSFNQSYSSNKVTTTWIQISRQNWNGFFSNASHQIMI